MRGPKSRAMGDYVIAGSINSGFGNHLADGFLRPAYGFRHRRARHANADMLYVTGQHPRRFRGTGHGIL